MAAIIDSLVVSPFAKTKSATLTDLILASAELLDVSIQAEKFTTTDDKSIILPAIYGAIF